MKTRNSDNFGITFAHKQTPQNSPIISISIHRILGCTATTAPPTPPTTPMSRFYLISTVTVTGPVVIWLGETCFICNIRQILVYGIVYGNVCMYVCMCYFSVILVLF